MWRYDSPIGVFFIKKLDNGQYGLIYRYILLESSASPENLADNVHAHCTGCYAWDALDGMVRDVPSRLAEWNHF